MRRSSTVSTRRGPAGADGPLLRLSRREIDLRLAAIAQEVASSFTHMEAERVEYLGESIYPRPIDTRRFIRIMSRHLVFN
jgi:hypothetical protein